MTCNIRLLFLCLLAIINTGCAQTLYSNVRPGQELVISQQLIIQPGSARVLLQAGKLTHAAALQLYQPRCWFIARQIKPVQQLISPGRFAITSVRETFETVYRQRGGLFLASLGFVDGLTAVDYATEMTIKSISQPDITRLVCSHWEDPDDALHLTLTQINQTLGSYAHLEQH